MITIKLESYNDNNKEYVAYYEITGYNMEENQDDYIANELTSWVMPINRYGKPDIKIVPNKIIIGIHSEYKQDVTLDYLEDALYSITGAKEDSLNDDSLITAERIPCPALYKDEIYYLVDADEFITKEELEEHWLNGFQGWGDDDYPGTFKKFVNLAIKDGIVREVEFLSLNESLKNKKRRPVKEDMNRPYIYFTKHGVGPGTLPRDVRIIDWDDINNYLTVLYLDRFLTTQELKDYDIYPETKNDEIMDRYGLYIDDNNKVVKDNE